MEHYKPIACSAYDNLELVCLYHYKIELMLDTGTVCGTALTLQTDPPAEYLIVGLADGDTTRIRIDRIHTLTVLTRPSALGTRALPMNGSTERTDQP